jgi:hypothetical protein
MDCSVSSRHPTWEAKLCGRCKSNCASSGFNLFLQVGTICMEVYEWLFTNQNKLGSILCPLWFTLSCQHMWTSCELWVLSLWICRPHIGSSWSSSSSRTTGGGARKISPFECTIYIYYTEKLVEVFPGNITQPQSYSTQQFGWLAYPPKIWYLMQDCIGTWWCA